MSFTPESMSKSPPDRFCSRENCNEIGDSTIKYFYDGKQIFMTPLTPKKVDGGLDLCLSHSKNYVAPKGWTLINKLVMPSYLTQPTQATSVQSSAGDTFFGFIFVAIVIVIGLFAGWKVIVWIFELDWDNGGTFFVQVPTKVRRP